MRRIPARIAAAVLVTGLVFSASACAGTPPGTGPAGQTSRPAGPDRVAVGLVAIADVVPIYVGRDKGFFAARGIELELHTVQGGAAIVPAVAGGEYAFGFSNTVSLLLASQRGLKLNVLASGSVSTGNPASDTGGLLVKDPSITRPAHLAGKRVATNTTRGIVDMMVRELVRRDGADPADVDFFEIGFPDMGPALEQGAVDGIFVTEPYLSAGKAKGWRLIGSYADVDSDLSIAVYFTSEAFALENGDLVNRFTEALKESLAYAEANPDEIRDGCVRYLSTDINVASSVVFPRWPAEVDPAAVQRLNDLLILHELMPTPGANLAQLLG